MPILKVYRIYHDYVRPHEALKGRTPAEACGITIQGSNKRANSDSERVSVLDLTALGCKAEAAKIDWRQLKPNLPRPSEEFVFSLLLQ